jgi:hypothetical protein
MGKNRPNVAAPTRAALYPADRGHALRGQRRGQAGIGQRAEQAEDRLARAQRARQLAVRLTDHHDQVGVSEQLGPAYHGRARFRVGTVGQPRAVPGPGFHEYLEPGAAQPRDHLRDERHPALAGRRLLDDSYLHGRDLTMSGRGRKAA